MIKIGNESYDVPQPRGWVSFGLAQRVAPVVTNVLGAIGAVVGSTRGDLTKMMDLDVGAFLAAVPQVGRVFTDMPPGELESLARALLAEAVVIEANGRKLPLMGSPGGDVFDLKFQGRFLDACQLLWHAAQVWYPDVFTRARMFIATSPAGASSAGSTTSSTSGPAGASSSEVGAPSTGSTG